MSKPIPEEDIYYRKVGKRYKRAGYDIPYFYPGVATLVMSDKNCTSYWTQGITPDNAAIKAASKLAVEKVVKIVAEASKSRMEVHNSRIKTDKDYLDKCKRAWDAYCKEMGDDTPMAIMMESHMDVAEKIVKAMLELNENWEKG